MVVSDTITRAVTSLRPIADAVLVSDSVLAVKTP